MHSHPSTISRLGICFAAVVASALTIGPAAAAPYQSYKATTCSSATTCFVNFQPAPAGQRLVITSASCRYSFPSSSALLSADLIVNGSGVRDSLMPFPLSTFFGGDSVYAANNTTLLYVPVGATVRAQMTLAPSANITMACKVSGTSEAP